MSSISNEINLNFKEICQDKLSECQIFKNARFLDTTEVVQFLFTPLVTSIKEISKNKTVDESIIVNGIKYKSAANFIEQMSKTTVYNSIQDESNIRNISVNNNNNYTIPFNVMFGFWEKVKENVNKTASNISDSIGVTFTDVKDYMESLKKKENEGSSNIYNFTSTKFNEMKKSVNLNGIGFS